MLHQPPPVQHDFKLIGRRRAILVGARLGRAHEQLGRVLDCHAMRDALGNLADQLAGVPQGDEPLPRFQADRAGESFRPVPGHSARNPGRARTRRSDQADVTAAALRASGAVEEPLHVHVAMPRDEFGRLDPAAAMSASLAIQPDHAALAHEVGERADAGFGAGHGLMVGWLAGRDKGLQRWETC